jgi:iron(III) transport system permease protein
LGFALPGIAVALGLVYFSSTYLGFLYQTSILLVFAYVILFLSPAVATNHASLLQFAPKLEEAARGLGKTAIQVFTTVTMPLISRGALTGMGLVFVLIMKELPATLILSPIGFATLATDVWSSASEVFYTQAAVSSLILLGMTALPITLLTFRYQR